MNSRSGVILGVLLAVSKTRAGQALRCCGRGESGRSVKRFVGSRFEFARKKVPFVIVETVENLGFTQRSLAV